ncbi:terminase large subunit domain-containing protein [Mariniluteicoccus endophyticus]
MDVSMLPEKRDYRRVIAFIEAFLVDFQTGRPINLKPFQKQILRNLYPARGEAPRMGLLSLPRGQGKSFLAGMLACYHLFADQLNPQVLIAASSEVQARRIVFKNLVLFVEGNPELSKRARIGAGSVEVPFNAGLAIALAATEDALQGWAQTFCVVDELHVCTAQVWESLVAGSLKREESLTLAISTPSRNPDSVMKTLVDSAREKPDPMFYFKEFTSDPSHKPLCECCIKSARPLTHNRKNELRGLGSMLAKMPEGEFRRLQLGQWDTQQAEQWVPAEAWDALRVDRRIDSQAEVIVAFDGSFSGDYSALVAVSIEPIPHGQVLGVWKPQQEGGRVPISEVEQAIRAACNRFSVKEVVADPYRWSRSLEILSGEGIPVVEFPNTASRMAPATAGLTAAIAEGQICHDGDTELRAHVLNARTRESDRGTMLTKATKKSKIDCVAALLMAHARVTHYLNKKDEPVRNGVYSW